MQHTDNSPSLDAPEASPFGGLLDSILSDAAALGSASVVPPTKPPLNPATAKGMPAPRPSSSSPSPSASPGAATSPTTPPSPSSAAPAGPSRLERFLATETVRDALRIWFQTDDPRTLDPEELGESLGRDIALLDQWMTEQVNVILHHPTFQRLEASWRGIQYLTESAASHDDPRIKVRLLNLSWKELARDVERAIDFDQSQFFRKIYNDEFGIAGGEPFSVLIGDYAVRHRMSPGYATNDVEILQHISHVAAAAFAPFVTGVDPSFFGLDSFTELELPLNLSRTFEQLEYTKWKAFRETEDARFVGLALPRVLMRLPYADGDGHGDGFRFREDVETADRANYLWGNAAFPFAEVLIRAFADCAWLADIRGYVRDQNGGGLVTGLPKHSFGTERPEVIAKVSADGIISDSHEAELGDLGFISLCHVKDTPFSVFYGNQSVQRPKKYDTLSATINARMSAMLQYMLCIARFAHYLKVLGREKIGTHQEAEDIERELHTWLQQYVTSDDNASQTAKSQYPLREASVQLRPRPDKPGCYQCVMHLRPHFQLDEISAAMKLITELSPPSA